MLPVGSLVMPSSLEHGSYGTFIHSDREWWSVVRVHDRFLIVDLFRREDFPADDDTLTCNWKDGYVVIRLDDGALGYIHHSVFHPNGGLVRF